MLLIYIGLIFLSLSWYPFTAIFESHGIHHNSSLWLPVVMTGLAVICLLFSKKEVNFEIKGVKILYIFVPSIIFMLFIPFPYNISSIFFIIYSILAFLKITTRKIQKKLNWFDSGLKKISSSIFICGLILAIHTIIMPVVFLLSSRFHSVEFSAPIFSFLLNLLGSNASHENGFLYLQIYEKVYYFIPSWESFGLFAFTNILAGAFCLSFLFRHKLKYYIILPFILIIYLTFRYIIIIYIFTEIRQVNVFWDYPILIISFLPLLFLLFKFFPEDSKENAANFKIDFSLRNKNNIILMLSFICFLVSCAFFFGYSEAGEKKGGRILLDEKHSNWEWSTEKFDTEWYGERSTYNYYSMAEFLKNYYKVDQKFEKLTENLLKNYDILFIKTPTEPFSEGEIKAVKSFVESGGSLFLVGDHTNVFGITTNLNPLAEEFGVKFNYDSQYDIEGELSIFNKPEIFPHPSVQSLPTFMFATGCTIDAPLIAENAIIGYGVKSLYADYSKRNFFPKFSENGNFFYGLLLQAAGVKHGKGRVFLFSDSTVWSNFYMFIPGKPELLLGILEWLNRKNGIFDIFRLLSLIIAAFFLVLSSILAFKNSQKIGRGNVIFILLASGFLVAPLSIKGIEYLNRISYPLPEPHTKYPVINFETEHSEFELPVLHITQNFEKSYHTFYVWLQRLGYVPALKNSYLESLKNSDAVVIINPVKPFTGEELKQTDEYLKKGGKIFLIDDPRNNNHNIANQLLSGFNLHFFLKGQSYLPVTILESDDDTSNINSSSAGAVYGGNTLLYSRFRKPETPKRYQLNIGNYNYNNPQFEQNKLNRNNPFTSSGPIRIDSIYSKIAGRNISKPEEVDTITLNPVLSIQNIGKGLIAVMPCSYIFTDKEMGNTVMQPNKNMRNIFNLEYHIFRDILKIKKQ